MKTQRRWAPMVLVALLCVALVGCGAGQDAQTPVAQKEVKPPTAEEAMQALQLQFPEAFEKVIVYDEQSDPNGLLGRPGQYIGKADFIDSRIEMNQNPTMTDEMKEGGTLECFENESTCNSRYEELCRLSGADMGAFGVNAYIYKYDQAIFRVSYDVTPSDAAAYQTAMDAILGEASTAYEGE